MRKMKEQIEIKRLDPDDSGEVLKRKLKYSIYVLKNYKKGLRWVWKNLWH